MSLRPLAPSRSDAYSALVQIGNRLNGTPHDVEATLPLIVDQAVELLGTDMGWLVLVDEDRDVLYPVVLRGFRSDRFLDVSLPVGLGVGGAAIAEHRPLVITDYREHEHPTSEPVRETMLAEGTVSLVCAPMFKDDRMIGTLYVANRSATEFTDEEAWLLGALAGQASVAIENGRLYDRLARQNRLLERSFAIHQELTAASLEETGLDGIAEVLSRFLGLPVVIEQSIVEPHVLRIPDGPAASDASVVTPITAGARRIGSIEVLGVTELDPLQTKALEQGTALLALELVKQRAASEVEWRLSGELMDALLESPAQVSPELVRRARHLHVDLEQPHRVLAIGLDPDGGTAIRVLAAARGLVARRAPGQGSQALGVKRANEVLVALPAALDHDAAGIAEELQQVAARAGAPASVGIGPQDASVAASYRGAMACLALARTAGRAGAVVDYDGLGSLRFLLDAADPRHAATIVREPLEPLIEHDRTNRMPLLQTTRAFVESGCNYARTAEREFIALSTLKYRLGKVEQVLGAHPTDVELAFRLRLAFKVLDLLEATGLDATAEP